MLAGGAGAGLYALAVGAGAGRWCGCFGAGAVVLAVGAGGAISFHIVKNYCSRCSPAPARRKSGSGALTVRAPVLLGAGCWVLVLLLLVLVVLVLAVGAAGSASAGGAGRRCCWCCWCCWCWCWPSVLLVLVCADHCTDDTAPDHQPTAPAPAHGTSALATAPAHGTSPRHQPTASTSTCTTSACTNRL